VPAADDIQLLESLPNPRAGLVALNHQRFGRLGCLVGVAGIEGRRRVVLDRELDGFRDLRTGKFGDDAKCEVDPCRYTT
jgi:hypothetical protein